MPSIFFYIFSALAIGGAVALVMLRNPVSSALSMVVSFIGMAVLFVGLNAYFVGIIQILVYAGAIMVLFLFIIMLLDLKAQERTKARVPMVVAGCIIPLLFLIQLAGVLKGSHDESAPPLQLKQAAAHFEARPTIKENLEKGALPDVHLVGETLFTEYNFPLQVIGVLLLVATIGVVALSKKGSDRTMGAAEHPIVGSAPDDERDEKETMKELRKPRHGEF